MDVVQVPGRIRIMKGPGEEFESFEVHIPSFFRSFSLTVSFVGRNNQLPLLTCYNLRATLYLCLPPVLTPPAQLPLALPCDRAEEHSTSGSGRADNHDDLWGRCQKWSTSV